jgi:hypothetical protein
MAHGERHKVQGSSVGIILLYLVLIHADPYIFEDDRLTIVQKTKAAHSTLSSPSSVLYFLYSALCDAFPTFAIPLPSSPHLPPSTFHLIPYTMTYQETTC